MQGSAALGTLVLAVLLPGQPRPGGLSSLTFGEMPEAHAESLSVAAKTGGSAVEGSSELMKEGRFEEALKYYKLA